jgi:hypothetical protein
VLEENSEYASGVRQSARIAFEDEHHRKRGALPAPANDKEEKTMENHSHHGGIEPIKMEGKLLIWTERKQILQHV